MPSPLSAVYLVALAVLLIVPNEGTAVTCIDDINGSCSDDLCYVRAIINTSEDTGTVHYDHGCLSKYSRSLCESDTVFVQDQIYRSRYNCCSSYNDCNKDLTVDPPTTSLAGSPTPSNAILVTATPVASGVVLIHHSDCTVLIMALVAIIVVLVLVIVVLVFIMAVGVVNRRCKAHVVTREVATPSECSNTVCSLKDESMKDESSISSTVVLIQKHQQ